MDVKKNEENWKHTPLRTCRLKMEGLLVGYLRTRDGAKSGPPSFRTPWNVEWCVPIGRTGRNPRAIESILGTPISQSLRNGKRVCRERSLGRACRGG